VANQQQVIAAARQSEETREKQLATTLAQIAAIKQTTQTPEEVLRELPSYLQLPEPLQALPYGQTVPVKQGATPQVMTLRIPNESVPSHPSTRPERARGEGNSDAGKAGLAAAGRANPQAAPSHYWPTARIRRKACCFDPLI
jgi:hypothetical protein